MRIRTAAVLAVVVAASMCATPALADNPPDDPGRTEVVADVAESVAGGVEVPTVSPEQLAVWIRGERESGQQFGYLVSLYTGKWFRPRKEDVRRCIIERESNANYKASGGGYYGAYQMSRALGIGATWEMQPEVEKEFGEEGTRIIRQLRAMTPDKWNRYWQDRAFWTIWSSPTGRGPGHWGGARC